MSDEQHRQFPEGWQRETIAKSFIKLQGGKEYLTVTQRIAWFQSEQRALIAAGLATQPYRIQIVEQSLTDTSAKYTLRVEDVLGNVVESTGSETKADFKDFDEKAYTKALGRCLGSMGYSTVEAMDRDEGESVIADSPQARPATTDQLTTIVNAAKRLGVTPPSGPLTFTAATNLIADYRRQYTAKQQQQQEAPV